MAYFGGQKRVIFRGPKRGFALINASEWGSQKGPKIPLFWPYFDPFLALFWPLFWPLFWRGLPKNTRKNGPKKGPKNDPKNGSFLGVKNGSFLGYPWDPAPGPQIRGWPKVVHPEKYPATFSGDRSETDRAKKWWWKNDGGHFHDHHNFTTLRFYHPPILG